MEWKESNCNLYMPILKSSLFHSSCEVHDKVMKSIHGILVKYLRLCAVFDEVTNFATQEPRSTSSA